MNNKISPKYHMELVKKVVEAIWTEYETYINVLFYIQKWHYFDEEENQNFFIYYKKDKGVIDLEETLHNIDVDILLKIAIDMGVETPDFIPSIPTFKNVIKEEYSNAAATFDKAFKQIESDPDIAIGLANSALESIIKEILKDERIQTKFNNGDTLYRLTQNILKEFKLFPNSEIPEEINQIGSGLLNVCQGIEKIRSQKTKLHGKMDEDYVVDDSLYAYFIINSVATIGLFLQSYYKKKFPVNEDKNIFNSEPDDGLPF
ncbi:MAG TPA: abortive infection family protein [Gallicola sp.]|nr:abortive infection family protein [Gallicola sp.]